MEFRRRQRCEEPEINLIPLIDVVLVIIIFLMLTTTFSRVSGLEINLPAAEAENVDIPPHEIVVGITASGEILINGQPLAELGIDMLSARLRQAAAEAVTEPVVVINADAKAAHQNVINVMQASQRAGLAHVTFATQATEP